jgi:hypothetical protein
VSQPRGPRTCCHDFTLAQWVRLPFDKRPRLAYINGAGVKAMLVKGDRVLFSSAVSGPLLDAERKSEVRGSPAGL